MCVATLLIQFLTYRPEDAPHTAIDVWAQVCDADHYIPARFTSACVDAFQAEMPGVRFTQARGAIFAIRSCRVVFAQVPVQSTPWRNSTPTEPVLEVEQCTLLGGIGELVHTDALRNVLY